jgi:NAD(P)-dependent dehydrogenase (short-subunit alcohol dehydrogenase family)
MKIALLTGASFGIGDSIAARLFGQHEFKSRDSIVVRDGEAKKGYHA